jgi:hypothetical protein
VPARRRLVPPVLVSLVLISPVLALLRGALLALPALVREPARERPAPQVLALALALASGLE